MSHESLESFKHLFSSVYSFFGGLRQKPNQMEVKGGTGIRKILDMKVIQNVVLSLEVMGGDIGYLRSTCLRGIWIKQVCSWPLTTTSIGLFHVLFQGETYVNAWPNASFWMCPNIMEFLELIMWLQGKYIYIYLVCKWEYVIHVFTAVNYVLYIYICYQN